MAQFPTVVVCFSEKPRVLFQEVLKELPFPNHHFLVSIFDFQGFEHLDLPQFSDHWSENPDGLWWVYFCKRGLRDDPSSILCFVNGCFWFP